MYAIYDVLDQYQLKNKRRWDAHKSLSKFNLGRLDPQTPTLNYHKTLSDEFSFLILESQVLEQERALVAGQAAQFPKDVSGFLTAYEELRNVGPGQNDPLFPWLAKEATIEQMKWFLKQEVAGEAGFDDLAALTQIKLPTRPKLEVARNFWDEMGRGQERGMHGPMLTRLAEELELSPTDIDTIVPESLALANLLMGLAINRRYAYHSVGALGIVELTAPDRAECVHLGLKRLGLSGEAQRYFLLHSTLDKKHSASWNAEVIAPLIGTNPEIAQAIAEGALMRLNAGAACFKRYRRELWATQ